MGAGGDTMHRERMLPTKGLVREEFTIEGMDRDELFFVAPLMSLEDNLDITIDFSHQRLRRRHDLRKEKFPYSLGTTAIVGGVLMPLVPALPTGPGESIDTTPAEETAAFPNLVALAQRWLAESGLPENDRAGRGTLLGAAIGHLGTFSIQPRRPGSRSPN